MVTSLAPRPSTEPATAWLWLFPATYLVHIAEELAAGFPDWLHRVSGAAFDAGQFVAVNAAAWLAMSLAVLAMRRGREHRWLIAALGAAVLVNALLHLGGSLLTGSYSPGAVSAGLLWLPLGVLSLRRSWASLPRAAFAAGALAGLAAHAVVSLLALTLGG